MREECLAAAEILPEQIDCPDVFATAGKDPRLPDPKATIHELARRFILVGLPGAYRESPTNHPIP
jgi:hypothetical protein